ncbi:Flp family type IVb pilin [Marinicauda salina]|uniref:Flp family type IVb pilin n=1 Tax=Marinicauda salina TaxID=2135793 RepID=A0A2U2BXA0_9PROT|nr:Flp family type IVb pilin [Marinicauda salina]PWE18599.1 Flp family type IVb pilin [Marinicauda salina]
MLKLFVKAQNALADVRKDIEGASLAEYALLLGLITVVLVTAVTALSGAIGGVLNTTANTIQNGG